MPEFLHYYKMPFWLKTDLGHLFPLFLPPPPVNLLSLKSFYSFMCYVENVYHLCVLIVLPFGRRHSRGVFCVAQGISVTWVFRDLLQIVLD